MIRTGRSAALAFAALVVACQGGQLGAAAPTLPSEVGVGTRATFAVAAPVGLLGLDADGRLLGHIVRLPPGAAATAPTLDPTGGAIVFALLQTTGETGFGSDIYSVNLDGSDLRSLLRHDRPNVFYASPSFDLNGRLYVHRRAARESGGQYTAGILQNEDTIERVDLRTGERRTILKDAAEPSVSPDGKTLVFVHMYQGDQDGLWIATADGVGAGSFFKTTDQFWFLQAPRVSPTGREIAWSSAGRTQVRSAPGASKPARVGGGVKLAHLEIPSEIFLAPLEGTSLRSIATTGDDVVPAWSPDGTRIAYVAVGTFYGISAAEGRVAVRAQGLGFLYGDPVWLR